MTTTPDGPTTEDPRLDPCPPWCTHHKVELRRKRTPETPPEQSFIVLHRHIVEPIEGCPARVVVEQYVSPIVSERRPAPEFVVTIGAPRLDVEGASALAMMLGEAIERLSRDEG